MKYIYSLSILALLFFLPVKSQEAKIDNLMSQRNGNFENNYGGWAKGGASQNIDFDITNTISNSHNSSSTKSLRVTFSNHQSGQEIIKHNSLTVNDSQYLIYSLWVKAQEANTTIRFKTLESNKKTNPFTFLDTNWHNIVIKSEANSGDLVTAGTACQIQIVSDDYTTKGATFFIDDITLTSGLFDTGFDIEAFSKTANGTAAIQLPVTADPGTNNIQHNWNPSKIWASVPQGPDDEPKTDQVESMEYSTEVKYNGSKSLKVVTKSTTTGSLMAVVNPKVNASWQFRYKTPANPTVEGSNGVSNNFDKIKYTLSYYMKTAANTDGVNKTNVKILDTENYVPGNDQTVSDNPWKKFEVSKIFDRTSITEGSEIFPVFRFASASTTYYIDNIKLTWEEGNETTFSSNSIDFPKLSIYPNPAENYFIAENAVINDNLEIFNVGGKLIKTQTIHSVNEKIDIEELNRGIYFVRVNDSRAVRLIKK